MMGGCSRPANSFLVSSDLPASAPMYAPESKVLSPEIPDAATRGRTTQKRASSAVKLSASLVSCTVVTTWERSLLSLIACTRPISTSLYLTLVLPASSPSAEMKVIVMIGPRSRMILTTKVKPMTAATIGMSQTRDGSQLRCTCRFGSGGFGCGAVGSLASVIAILVLLHCRMFIVHGVSTVLCILIPDQAWIEAQRCQHGQHHHGTKCRYAHASVDLGESFNLHQPSQQRHHKYIEHGPASNGFHQPIQLGALQALPAAASACTDRKQNQRHQLEQRHQKAGNKHYHGQLPRAGRPEIDNAAHNRVLLHVEQGRSHHHRQQIGRNVHDAGGNQKRPGTRETIRLALPQTTMANRALSIFSRTFPDCAAMMATMEITLLRTEQVRRCRTIQRIGARLICGNVGRDHHGKDSWS